MVTRLLLTLGLAFGGNGILAPVRGDDVTAKDLVEVGSTKDACSKENDVTFTGKEGEVRVKANEKKLVALPASTRELQWYCGDSRERCANDQPFDHVLCERAGNGAIAWRFYVKK